MSDAEGLEPVFILLGSNLGDKRKYLAKAISKIKQKLSPPIQVSGIYETEPWGFEDTKTFYNQAVLIHSDLPPGKLLNICLQIEKELGRNRRSSSPDRVIDIDILLYGQKIVRQKKCTIPHSRLHQRNFAMVPLSEIAPGQVHPEFGMTISELVQLSTDKLKVSKLETYTLPS